MFGKSTFLSVVTSATPKIADYHFTTLEPNLGVVKTEYGDSFVIADIPGIIEGASNGVGLRTSIFKTHRKNKTFTSFYRRIRSRRKKSGRRLLYNTRRIKKI